MGAGNTRTVSDTPAEETKIHSVQTPSGTMYYTPTSMLSESSPVGIESLYLPHISKDADHALIIVQPNDSKNVYFIEQDDKTDRFTEEANNDD